MTVHRDIPLIAALAAFLVALALPMGALVGWIGHAGLIVPWLAAAAGAAVLLVLPGRGGVAAALATAATVAGALGALNALALGPDAVARTAPGLWAFVVGLGLLAWRAMDLLSGLAASRNPAVARLFGLIVPAVFGLWLLFLWQVIVVGFGVPQVLLPAPTVIGDAMAGGLEILAADFHQTFVRAVIPGFLIGCASGFVVAVLVDRVPFLQRGLLPLGNLVSALPIVGIAPIMVMWFGFDWQSKAAVVVVMTFFPMLVNTIAGLNATGAMERDLMHSYAAGYFQTLFRARLPNALPFIFNALKINSTLALIGAIVAEFFGTPIVGMGFRISTEVGRMNIDLVWATIAVAALSGSAFYGVLAALERSVTFWHASYRHRR